MGHLELSDYWQWNRWSAPAVEITDEDIFAAWLQSSVTDLRTLEEYTEDVRDYGASSGGIVVRNNLVRFSGF
jgi:hypothetical protein